MGTYSAFPDLPRLGPAVSASLGPVCVPEKGGGGLINQSCGPSPAGLAARALTLPEGGRRAARGHLENSDIF